MEDNDVYFKIVSKNRMSCSLSYTHPYSLFYPKDSVVWGVKGTFGVLIFDTDLSAHHFMSSSICDEGYIIRVKALSPTFKPKSLALHRGILELTAFYKNPTSEPYLIPPDGTLCTKGVYVLT